MKGRIRGIYKGAEDFLGIPVTVLMSLPLPSSHTAHSKLDDSAARSQPLECPYSSWS